MLKTLARRTGILQRLRATWHTEMERASAPLRKELIRLASMVDQLSATQQTLATRFAKVERDAQQVKHAFRLNDAQRDLLAEADGRLQRDVVIQHVRKAIQAATLEVSPFPHIVVEKLLPDGVYKLALDGIPPGIFFGERDPIKQNLRIPMEFGPTLAARVWDFIDTTIARDAIRPAVLEKFHDLLQQHYEAIFGPGFRERAHALPQAISGGRLMLRRAGYHLDPHRDPKRTMLTCLMYFARTKDSETYGTQIFAVHGDREADYTQTFYPAQAGLRCELVKMVPYRPNSALMFLNSGGAHGADIPADASRKLERYAYQFYIGPDLEALNELIADLPAERRARWLKKGDRGE